MIYMSTCDLKCRVYDENGPTWLRCIILHATHLRYKRFPTLPCNKQFTMTRTHNDHTNVIYNDILAFVV